MVRPVPGCNLVFFLQNTSVQPINSTIRWLTDADEINSFGLRYQISIPDMFRYSIVLRQFSQSIDVQYPALFSPAETLHTDQLQLPHKVKTWDAKYMNCQ